MQYTEILSKLISFDTTTKTDTTEAAGWIKSYLQACGMEAYLVYNPARTRASVVACYTGNTEKELTILNGHLDVVPAQIQDWNTNPFTLVEQGDLLYGRGTSDMKGSIAVALSLVPVLMQRKKNFALIFTHDEEVFSNGVQEIFNDEQTKVLLKRATGCIVMEPTKAQLVIGQKTADGGNIKVFGKAVHSSNPAKGINALAHAIEIYKKFYALAEELKETPDIEFEVPNSVADILVLNAGEANNIIPAQAHLGYCCRFLSNKTATVFRETLQKQITEYEKTVAGLSVSFCPEVTLPALETDINAPFVQKLANVFDFAPYKKVSFGTEAGYFSEKGGIPTVICGAGDIAQAHTKNEFIAKEQLAHFYNRLDSFFTE